MIATGMIAAIETDREIGIGVYTPTQAAFYARVRTQTINRWLFGDKKGEAVVSPELGDEKTVTFRDFVQALAIRAIRTQYPEISLQRIRKAVELAKDRLGVSHPLAHPHRTFIYQGRELVLELHGKLIQLSGKYSKNLMIGPIAELYMESLEFDDEGLAKQYRAWGSEERPILMDPHRRFGEPIVETCGYTAETLWNASIVEGGFDAAAEAYGVNRSDVILACEYYDHLMSVAA
jgi:uncharacterized protein (DUF433 family)